MLRFCLCLVLFVSVGVLAQTPSQPETSAEPSPQVEAQSPLGAGLGAPTLAVLGVLAVLLGTTVTTTQCLDDTSCGGGPFITATATGTR